MEMEMAIVFTADTDAEPLTISATTKDILRAHDARSEGPPRVEYTKRRVEVATEQEKEKEMGETGHEYGTMVAGGGGEGKSEGEREREGMGQNGRSGDGELDAYLAECAEMQYGFVALRAFLGLCVGTPADTHLLDVLVIAVNSLWNVYRNTGLCSVDPARRAKMHRLMEATLDCLSGVEALDAAVSRSSSATLKQTMRTMVRKIKKYPTGPLQVLDMAKILWVYRTTTTAGPIGRLVRQIERLEEMHRVDFKDEATTGGPEWSIEYPQEFEAHQRKEASRLSWI